VWSVESAADSAAPCAALWELLADPSGWTRWNPTVASVEFDGPLAEGVSGVFKPRSGPRAKVVVRDVRVGRGFTTVSQMPGAELRVVHELVDLPTGGARVIERSVLQGALSQIWGLILGRQFARDMRDAVQGLVRVADAELER
jgi:uncharacterized protein YndB with AHSA1/START domain